MATKIFKFINDPTVYEVNSKISERVNISREVLKCLANHLPSIFRSFNDIKEFIQGLNTENRRSQRSRYLLTKHTINSLFS